MNILGVIIGVLGIVLTILFFWIQRIKKYPGQLSYSVLDCSRIVRRSESGFKDVSLHYKDYAVNDDLYYVKFLVFNQRSSDVKAEKGGAMIALELNEKSKWLVIRVKDESQNVGSDLEISEESGRIAMLSFPLLKKGEHIVGEGLIESSLSLVDNEDSIFMINHRIAQLDTCEFFPGVTERRYNRCKWTVKLFGSLMCFALLLLCVSIFLPKRSTLLYRNSGYSTDETEYYVSIDKKNRITIQEYRPLLFTFNARTVLSKEEFELNYSPTYSFHDPVKGYFGLCFASFIIIVYGFLLYDYVRDIHRYRILRKYKE